MHSLPQVNLWKPDSDWRRPFYYIAKSKIFNGSIMFFILVNSVILALKWYGQSQEYNAMIEKINYGLTSLFSVELLINFIGFGPRYLKDNWNLFDFLIIMLSWVASLIGAVSDV
jgi:hypothetical protein